MANAAGGPYQSSPVSAAAARAAASVGLITSGLTWSVASLMKLRSNLLLTFMPILGIGFIPNLAFKLWVNNIQTLDLYIILIFFFPLFLL